MAPIQVLMFAEGGPCSYASQMIWMREFGTCRLLSTLTFFTPRETLLMISTTSNLTLMWEMIISHWRLVSHRELGYFYDMDGSPFVVQIAPEIRILYGIPEVILAIEDESEGDESESEGDESDSEA